MFDTARKTSARFGRPAKLVLTIVAAFTLLTGGAALADESTSPGTHDSQASAAESLLQRRLQPRPARRRRHPFWCR